VTEDGHNFKSRGAHRLANACARETAWFLFARSLLMTLPRVVVLPNFFRRSATDLRIMSAPDEVFNNTYPLLPVRDVSRRIYPCAYFFALLDSRYFADQLLLATLPSRLHQHLPSLSLSLFTPRYSQEKHVIQGSRHTSTGDQLRPRHLPPQSP
jgi:hypothetical protein